METAKLTKKKKAPVYPKRLIKPNYALDEEMDAYIFDFIPQRVLDMGFDSTYLYNAMDMYFIYRIEPEKLMKRDLGNPWNLFGFDNLVMAIEIVNHRHSWFEKNIFWTTYHFAPRDTDEAKRLGQFGSVNIIDLSLEETATATPTLCIDDFENNKTFKYNFEKREWSWEARVPKQYIITQENQKGRLKSRTSGFIMTLV